MVRLNTDVHINPPLLVYCLTTETRVVTDGRHNWPPWLYKSEYSNCRVTRQTFFRFLCFLTGFMGSWVAGRAVDAGDATNGRNDKNVA